MMKGGRLRLARHEGKYYDQSVRGKVDEAREEVRDEGRVRIMHYSWWLLGLREKGLCSISVFEASTLSPERERAREIESETGGMSRAGGVAFPEGRSREKAAGGCRDMEGRRWRKGIEQGGLQFRNGFHSADEPPRLSPFVLLPRTTVRLLFLSVLFVPFFARDSTGVDQPRSRLPGCCT